MALHGWSQALGGDALAICWHPLRVSFVCCMYESEWVFNK
jgi:hypothetical protein